MRYTKKIGLTISAIVLGLTLTAISTSAQVRVGVHFGGGYRRTPIVRRYYAPNPFRYGGYYGFYGTPYQSYRSERNYDRQSLQIARHRLNKDEEKYYSDDYLTPEEAKKLDSDYYKLNRDRRRLRNDW